MESQIYKLSQRITYDTSIYETTPSYKLTSDIELDNNKIYYVAVSENTYAVVNEPNIEDIATYYERDDKGYVTYQKMLSRLLEDSKFIGLSIRFPFQEYYDLELPKKYNNWQLRCCEELYTLIGSLNIKSYTENGLSWIRDSGNISESLRDEIMSKVGVIVDDDNEED